MPNQAAVELKEIIDYEIENAARSLSIPSISVGIVHAGKIFHYKSVGNKRRESNSPVDKNSLFQIASLSKMLTGIIANSLIRREYLDPAESIVTYLSDVLTRQAADHLKSVTVESVLHHHSGILDESCSLYRNRLEGEPWLKGYTKAELVSDINSITLTTESNHEFQYSNCGYAILALISELVTGKNYQTLLDEYVTRPYKLSNSVTNPNGSQSLSLAIPYKKTDRELPTKPSIMGMAIPASAVYSTVADLLNLQLQQIRAYHLFFSKGVSNSLVLTEQTSSGPADSIRYGYGLMEIHHPKTTLYGHDGDADGYASFYSFIPEYNTGMVVLTSSGGPWVEDLCMTILSALIENSDNP